MISACDTAQALASRMVSDAPGGRRRLSAVTPIDLTDTATIKACSLYAWPLHGVSSRSLSM